MLPTALLLLHSFPFDSRLWRPVCQTFQRERPVLAPDLRGFGRNRQGPFYETLEPHACDLIRLLDEAGVSRVFVVGLCLGGHVALTLCRLAPERVAGLLLAATRVQADTAETQRERDELVWRIEREGLGFLPDLWLPRLVTPGCPAAVLAELRALILEQSPAGAIAALRLLRNRPDLEEVLRQVVVPTTVLCGDLDVITPPTVMREVMSAVPHSLFVLVHGAGHLPCVEMPEVFCDTVRDALQQVR